MDAVHENTYVSLNIQLNDATTLWQNTLCELYNVQPRKELHVTLGFLGNISNKKIFDLENYFRNDRTLILSAKVSGVGAATDTEKTSRTLKDRCEVLKQESVVLWATVELSNDIISFRNEFIETCTKLGIDSSNLSRTFFPHITLGSRRHNNPHYDVYKIQKTASLKSTCDDHKTVVDKLHITTAQMHPDSLVLIND